MFMVIAMGTITINVDDGTEKIFRHTVEKELGKGKGKLGSAVAEALDLWVNKQKEEQIMGRELALLEKGFMLGKYTIDRDDLYERKH